MGFFQNVGADQLTRLYSMMKLESLSCSRYTSIKDPISREGNMVHIRYMEGVLVREQDYCEKTIELDRILKYLVDVRDECIDNISSIYISLPLTFDDDTNTIRKLKRDILIKFMTPIDLGSNEKVNEKVNERILIHTYYANILCLTENNDTDNNERKN